VESRFILTQNWAATARRDVMVATRRDVSSIYPDIK
jgi:hypothetical protein